MRPHSTAPVVRALRLSTLDGALHAIMLGVSESYLGALAVELGHGPSALALLVTLPLLAGAVSQTLTAPLVDALGGRKRLVVLAAGLQAATQLAFFWIARERLQALGPLLAVKTLFAMTGVIGAPAWNAWMATLARGAARERYFAFRSGTAQLVLFVAFAGAGVALHAVEGGARLLVVFEGLFVVAFLARASSALALSFQYDPGAASPLGPGAALLPSRERFSLAIRTGEWRVAFYLAALMMGAQVAIPFFTPYMLRDLDLDYGAYASLIGLSMLVKAGAFPLAHRLARRVGLRAVLFASGVLVAVLPSLWATIPSARGLFFVEFLSGIAWAGLEYTSFQLLLSSARPECRIEFLSLAATLAGATQLLGAIAAGALLESARVDYPTVFFVSSALRAAALGFLLPSVSRVALPPELPKLWWRLTSVRVSGGTVRQPIVSDAPPSEPPGGQ